MRKCNAVEAEKEMLEINDLIKLLMSLNDECSKMLGEDEKRESDKWLDMVDKQTFFFQEKSASTAEV